MTTLQRLDSGVIYRNPKPHLRSLHAYFPWVTVLPSGDLLASFQVGSAFEAADAHCELARSSDGGQTWVQEGPLYPGTGPAHPTSDCLKVTCDRQAGVVVAFGTRFDRSDPEAAICNEATGGILPMDVLVARSHDEGHTWSDLTPLATPLPGPFEAQAPVCVLADGPWIVPMSTWRAWDGSHPNGDKAIALISEDKGDTWGGPVTVMLDPDEKLVFWEMRLCELEPGRVLALAWAHDKTRALDIENQYAISEDGGRSFLPFSPAGIPGQSICPLYLGDGRVLITYNHRYGEPGVRARVARVEPAGLVTEAELVLWGVGAEGSGAAREHDKSMVREMSSFKFGQPSPHRLPDGTILTVHWCVDDCVGEIRWNTLTVSTGA